MHILYISSEYPPETGYGGIGTYTFHAATGMASQGHTVHVIALSTHQKHKTISAENVTVHRIIPENYPLPHGRFFYPFRKLCYRSIPHLLIRLSWAHAVRKKIIELQIENQTFDIIEFPECGSEGLMLPVLPDSHMIARLHTPWQMIRKMDHIKEFPVDRILLSETEKWSVKRACRITSPSNALARIMKKKWKLKDVTVIPNPLPTNEFPLTKGSDWIYTGRVERRKGVHHLIQAYSQICKTYSPPPLKLIGRAYGTTYNGEDYGESIRKFISRNNLEKRIKWIEGCSLDKIRYHLKKSSVAFFPSLWENFPYSCLEAMACGLAVAVSDCGGFPEIIEQNKSGILVSTDSVEEWTHAMKRFIMEPNLHTYLGRNARQKVRESFDSQSICRAMENYYLTVLQENGNGNPSRH